MTNKKSLLTEEEKAKTQLVQELLDIANTYAQSTGADPSDVTRDFYIKHTVLSSIYKYSEIFGSFKEFKKKANLIDSDNEFSRRTINIIEKETKIIPKTGKRYVVTSVIAGVPIYRAFFDTLLNYCKETKSELVILPMKGIESQAQNYPPEIQIHSDHFATDYILSNYLSAKDLRLHPQQRLPLTGLDSLTTTEFGKSIIIASPKQMLKFVSSTTDSYPKMLHSTGTISLDTYYKDARPGHLSKKDHIYGALIVEVEPDHSFHIRQIQSSLEDGSFYDLDKLYKGNNVKQAKAVAIYAGDFHAGSLDPDALKATQEQIKLLKPKYFITGDIFDAYSISHHHQGKMEIKVNRPEKLSTLEKELLNMIVDLNKILSTNKELKIVRVKGNHDEHLEKYLNECRYAFDPQNHAISLELAMSFVVKHMDPIENWLKEKYPEVHKRITFLKRDDSFILGGIECAQHGDLGQNGSRGSTAGLEKSYGKSVTGHSHTPTIMRDVWVVGTMSKLDMGYNRGPSTWLHTNCAIYENGQRQLLTCIKGKYKL